MELSGKVAIVTGGGRGIGRAITVKLAKNGATVVVVDRNINRAKESADALISLGFKAAAFQTDVTRKVEVDEVVKRVIAEFGRIDILVNNAGWAKWQLFQENNPELWDDIIDVNLKGLIYCSRAVLDHMIERKKGKVVNIASDSGRSGDIGMTVYAAAKAGVIGFTKSLALEMAKYNINVNCISPGITETPLLMQGMKLSPESAKEFESMALRVPLGRMAKPEDIAEAVFFFSSSASDYITGQVLSVNGGNLMPG